MSEVKTVYRNSDGVRRTMITDSDRPGLITVNTEVDMTQTIETNKVIRDLVQSQPRSSVRLLARGIPMTVYEKSILEQWDDKDWNRWLEDPDNKLFRISEEKL